MMKDQALRLIRQAISQLEPIARKDVTDQLIEPNYAARMIPYLRTMEEEILTNTLPPLPRRAPWGIWLVDSWPRESKISKLIALAGNLYSSFGHPAPLDEFYERKYLIIESLLKISDLDLILPGISPDIANALWENIDDLSFNLKYTRSTADFESSLTELKSIIAQCPPELQFTKDLQTFAELCSKLKP